MYHSEAFYQYLLRGRRGPLTFVPLATDFELFDQSHFHKTKTPPTTTPHPTRRQPRPAPNSPPCTVPATDCWRWNS